MITCSSVDSEQLLHYSCNSRVSDSARTCTRDFRAFQGLTVREFELLEGMQQQSTGWTRHQVVCIVFKEIVQLTFI